MATRPTFRPPCTPPRRRGLSAAPSGLKALRYRAVGRERATGVEPAAQCAASTSTHSRCRRTIRLRSRVVRLTEQTGARPASGGVVTLPALRAAENTERRFTAPRPQTDPSHAAESLSQDPEPTALPPPSRWSRTSVATLPPRL